MAPAQSLLAVWVNNSWATKPASKQPQQKKITFKILSNFQRICYSPYYLCNERNKAVEETSEEFSGESVLLMQWEEHGRSRNFFLIHLNSVQLSDLCNFFRNSPYLRNCYYTENMMLILRGSSCSIEILCTWEITYGEYVNSKGQFISCESE